ncbi:MAG: fumarylacetoacetate hydrolase family protein [Ignavibacteriae bacterium]|nr:fumarylacetoacetate hydrolase family protein [Ignavibacteriota bacterium]MCB9210428.1 fumarylacetoacetate hydrolase family protein [Ignavibacteriales bacterium]MCB9219681.1 fumarylacetoacetate hydrolase family protein [Ignavibacteriales bacterium]MCB9259815.1 fumarylacetoacetate hydrolase family protein [Ignavibacteriales bacterium]
MVRSNFTNLFLIIAIISLLSGNVFPQINYTDQDYKPKRVNKTIELFEMDQPVYYKYTNTLGGYEEGIEMAQTWADYIVYDMEHKPLDFRRLRDFMTGLVDGGPTPSGHRTPTVIVVLPVLGIDEISFMGGSWMVQQALATGIHGIHLPRARDPKAVVKYIQSARYPIHKQSEEIIGEGTRGWGSHKFAAWVWGIEEEEYLKKADVWPLNPDGEIILGVKIEDPKALENASKTLSLPGLAFAEHGPRDFGFSLGFLEGRADPPVPKGVENAGKEVLELCKKNGLYFLDNVLPDNVKSRIDEGVKIGAGSNEQAAMVGRLYTKRIMPWEQIKYCRYKYNNEISYGLVKGNTIFTIDKAPWFEYKKTGDTKLIKEVKLLNPSEPQNIIGLSKAYKSAWQNDAPPKTVRWFLKPQSSATSTKEEIKLPSSVDKVKVESELVIVIGEHVKDANEEEAENAIFGYTIGNDIVGDADSYVMKNEEKNESVDNILSSGLKIGDNFSPFGPFIYPNINWQNRKWNLTVVNSRKGKKNQHNDNTSNMIYLPKKIVSDLSKVLTLNPGDIIFSGTSKALIAEPGDTVIVKIEGMDVLINTIVAN